jgi:hypothetical protein
MRFPAQIGLVLLALIAIAIWLLVILTPLIVMVSG